MNDFMDSVTLDKLHVVELELLNEFVRICEKNNLNYFLYGGTLLGAIRHNGFIPWDDDLDIAMPRKDYEKFLKIVDKELNNRYEIDNYHTNKLCYLNFTKIRKKNTLFIQNFQLDNYDGPKGIWIDIFPLDELKKEKGILQTVRIKIIKLIRSVAHYKSNIFLGEKKICIKKVIAIIFKIVPLSILLTIQDRLMKRKYKDSRYFINIASQYDYRKQTMPKNVFFPVKKHEFEGNLYNIPNKYDFFLKRIYGDYMKLPPKEKRVTHNPVEIKF